MQVRWCHSPARQTENLIKSSGEEQTLFDTKTSELLICTGKRSENGSVYATKTD